MTLQEKVRADMVAAMKAHDEVRRDVLRGLMTLCTQELTATKRTPTGTLTDDEVLALIKRAHKQRKEAASQYHGGGRDDLALKEDAEAVILEEYLPAQLSRDEVEKVVDELKQALGISQKKDTGKLMGAVMKELKGQADGTMVKEIVAARLT